MNLEPTGEIIATEHRGHGGSLERIEWEWRGGDLAYLSYTRPLVRSAQINDDIIVLGPFRLRIIKHEWPFCIVARDGFKARLLYRMYRCVRYTEVVYRRLILTAAVWGLARYDRDCIPTWRNVYALDRIARWFER